MGVIKTVKIFPHRFSVRINQAENDPERIGKALLQWAEAITYPNSPIFPIIAAHLLPQADYSSSPYLFRKLLSQEIFKAQTREDIVASLVAGAWVAYSRWDPNKGDGQNLATWLSWIAPFEISRFLLKREIKENDCLSFKPYEDPEDGINARIDQTVYEIVLEKEKTR